MLEKMPISGREAQMFTQEAKEVRWKILALWAQLLHFCFAHSENGYLQHYIQF